MNTYTHVPTDVMRTAMLGLGNLLDNGTDGQGDEHAAASEDD